ncbi:MAG: hypothetical protein IMZ69_00605, partial [Spirochaetes bacterium]|nr:hypothetical protein [Spirochaetota bacterium]
NVMVAWIVLGLWIVVTSMIPVNFIVVAQEAKKQRTAVVVEAPALEVPAVAESASAPEWHGGEPVWSPPKPGDGIEWMD